jgi:hypothetical protein
MNDQLGINLHRYLSSVAGNSEGQMLDAPFGRRYE